MPGPKTSTTTSEKAFSTAVVCAYPGSEFTNPDTITHALPRSRSPSARCTLAITDSAASRADRCACSNGTSSGTRPNGPAGEPSGFCAPWPDTSTRDPETRTQLKAVTTDGGKTTG